MMDKYRTCPVCGYLFMARKTGKYRLTICSHQCEREAGKA